MPEWLLTLSNLVNIIGLTVILVWTWNLGKELGRLKEQVKTHETKLAANDAQTLACTQLFRKISIDVSAMSAKIDILLAEFQRRKGDQ